MMGAIHLYHKPPGFIERPNFQYELNYHGVIKRPSLSFVISSFVWFFLALLIQCVMYFSFEYCDLACLNIAFLTVSIIMGVVIKFGKFPSTSSCRTSVANKSRVQDIHIKSLWLDIRYIVPFPLHLRVLTLYIKRIPSSRHKSDT